MSVASLGVSDIDRWVARLRKSGAGEASIRNQHTVVRAALQQVVRWEWIDTNPASAAPIEQSKRQQKGTLTNDEVRALIEAADEVHEMAPLVFRLAAETGARRGELAALRWEKFVDDKVVVDGQIIVSTFDGVRAPSLQPTKTGSRRVVTLRSSLVQMVGEKATKYADVTQWLFTPDADPPNPTASAGGGVARENSPASTTVGASTTCATGQPPNRSRPAKTSAPSPTASATPTQPWRSVSTPTP